MKFCVDWWAGWWYLSNFIFGFFIKTDFFPDFFRRWRWPLKFTKKISDLCGLERPNLCIYKTIWQKSDKMNHPTGMFCLIHTRNMVTWFRSGVFSVGCGGTVQCCPIMHCKHQTQPRLSQFHLDSRLTPHTYLLPQWENLKIVPGAMLKTAE